MSRTFTDLPAGIGNVKRTPQEETLLVLFGTAISNLVSGYFATENPLLKAHRFSSRTSLISTET